MTGMNVRQTRILWRLMIAAVAGFVYFLPGIVELHIGDAPEFLKAAYFVSSIAAFGLGIGLIFNRTALGALVGVALALFQVLICRC
jgi:hypothetical protein